MSTEQTNEQLLEQQLNQLVALENVLDTEKEILTKHDPEQLAEITEQKNQLLLAIQALDEQFAQSVSFKEEKSAGKYVEQLSTIKSSLLRCKDKNFVNGQVIEHSQLAVERMKTSLLQNHNKSSMTYDEKGKASGGLSSLNIKA